MVKKKKSRGSSRKNVSKKNNFNRNLVIGVVVLVLFLVVVNFGSYSKEEGLGQSFGGNEEYSLGEEDDIGGDDLGGYDYKWCNADGQCDPLENSINCPMDCQGLGECNPLKNSDDRTSNPACGVPTPVCDSETETCVACIYGGNSDDHAFNRACKDPTPACNVFTNTCVACAYVGNSDDGAFNRACKDPTPACNVFTNTCVACVSRGDSDDYSSNTACKDPLAPACNLFTNTCVECGYALIGEVNSNCNNPLKPACDLNTYKCIGCRGDFDCENQPDSRTYCKISTGACVDQPGGASF